MKDLISKINLSPMGWVKVGLAVLMLMCLLDMPYGFYTLVRFVAMVAFGFMAYKAYEEKREAMIVIFGALALLFQPFAKLSIDRNVWICVDIAVAAWLLWMVYKEHKSGIALKSSENS